MPKLSFHLLRALAVVGAIGAPAFPLAAQYAQLRPAPPDPGAALADALRRLASQPRDFQSLITAGRASLDLGDTQAAAGFYGRAEEVGPQSPMPKIGIGAAMTLMGDARGGLTYFDRALQLGAPPSLLALDRGLAFDLTGQQSRAQADYRMAMFGAQADEARRRLALSLAISRDIKGAAATLEPLLARRDPKAVRTNAFVLALAGDREGARRTIDAAMPGAGARFEPFFRMLPVLRADEKAMAVHLGEFPKDAAHRYAQAQPVASSPVVSIGNDKRTAIGTTRRRTAQADTARRTAAKPPVKVAQKPPVKAAQKPPIRIAEATRRALREAAEPSTYLEMVRPSLDRSRFASRRRTDEPAATAATPPPEPRPGFAGDELAPRMDVVEDAEPLVPINVGPVLNREGEPIVTAEASTPPPPAPTPKLEIERPPAPKPKIELARLDPAKAAAKPKTEAAKSKAEPAKAREPVGKEPPSPHFVQLASGAHADRMAGEYKKIKAKKPDLFAGRTARVTKGKELFRLVIGPFKSRDESGQFVNQLAKAGIDGFPYTAPDGMTFDKISAQ